MAEEELDRTLILYDVVKYASQATTVTDFKRTLERLTYSIRWKEKHDLHQSELWSVTEDPLKSLKVVF